MLLALAVGCVVVLVDVCTISYCQTFLHVNNFPEYRAIAKQQNWFQSRTPISVGVPSVFWLSYGRFRTIFPDFAPFPMLIYPISCLIKLLFGVFLTRFRSENRHFLIAPPAFCPLGTEISFLSLRTTQIHYPLILNYIQSIKATISAFPHHFLCLTTHWFSAIVNTHSAERHLRLVCCPADITCFSWS